MREVVEVEDGYYRLLSSPDCIIEVKDGLNALYRRYSGATYELIMTGFLLTPYLVRDLFKMDIPPVIIVNY